MLSSDADPLRRYRLLGLAFLTLLVPPSCAPGASSGPQGRLSIDLGAHAQVRAALSAGEVSSFRVRIFESTPPGSGVLFDSDCQPFTSVTYEIGPFEVGDGLGILMDLFGDASCGADTLRFRAYRGDVQIREDKVLAYTLLPYPVGGFATLPLPSQESRARAASTPCSTTDECVQKVHPAAVCRAGEGRCAMDSLFPLNSRALRGFHKSLGLTDGSVVAIGGLGSATSDGGLLGTEGAVERFDPASLMFSAPEVPNYSGDVKIALQVAVPLDGQTFFTAGGLGTLGLRRAGDRLVFEVPVEVCSSPTSCASNVVNLATLVDLSTNRAKTTTLARPVFAALADRIPGDKPSVAIAGGLTTTADGAGFEPNNGIMRCTVTDGEPACEDLGLTLSSLRFAQASACLDRRGDDTCGRILYLGGHGATQSAAGDIFDPVTGKLTALTLAQEARLPAGWSLVPSSDGLLAFGGTNGEPGSAPNVPPLRVRITGSVVQVERIPLIGIDEARTYRAFPAVVQTRKGEILVIGGLDGANNSTRSVLRFDADGNFVDEVQMKTPRFGHTATPIGAGPHQGSILVQGGFVLEGNVFRFAAGAEVYGVRPGSP